MTQFLSDILWWSSSEKIPVVHHNGSVFDVLHSDVLEQVYSILLDNKLHGVAITFPESEVDTVASLSTYVFSSGIRQKNLWWHLDAFDRPESKQQILTWLYSPHGSYSAIPTQTTLTGIIDERIKQLFASSDYIRSHEDELLEYKEKVLKVLWSSEERAFFTLLQNCFLPHREINAEDWNKLLWIRDDFTRSILRDPTVEKWEFYTQQDKASLLLFRNGLWENRDVSHTRFHIWDTPWVSVWNVYNLSIHTWWVLQPNLEPKLIIPQGIKFNHGEITNTKRKGIIPQS